MLGVLGTLAVELVHARTENLQARREALRLACADFTTAVALMRNLAIEVMKGPGDNELTISLNEAHREARASYERLRLTAASLEVQASGRCVLRYAYGLLRQAEGKPPREDELDRGPLMMLHDSLIALYAGVRREIGTPHAEDVYREPEDWIGPSVIKVVDP